MKKLTGSVIGILILLLSLWGGSWTWFSIHERPAYAEATDGEDEANAEEEVSDEKTSATEADEEQTKEIELDEVSERTLDMIRSFWKREEIVLRPKKKAFPPFIVPSRKTQLENYPCQDCHEDAEINVNRERVLTEEHTNIVLDHGEGRFWCLTCHNIKEKNYLRSLKDIKIDFDQSYLVCGQCHGTRQKDWFYGGHGKRIGSWNGKRQILLCTECHDPHSPAIKFKAPNPPPKVRKGLAYVPTQHFEHLKTWEEAGSEAKEESHE